ncbi:MAG: hypothetical protein LBN36_03320 [Clostridiales Family XIII bacterium]|jgi:hypothetical protein|nr:hypothetical protein [Clostridiales Family XIII bacterium]
MRKSIWVVTLFIILGLSIGVFSACSNESAGGNSTIIDFFTGILSSDEEQDEPYVSDSAAANWLAGRIRSESGRLYVYKDSVDVANRFTQKLWVSKNFTSFPTMDETGEGLDGTTGIEVAVAFPDEGWDGYLFTVGRLSAGSSNPEPNYGTYDAGYDLSGAEKLVFYAKGASGGERVEFFTAGLGYDHGNNRQKYADSSRKITLDTVTLTNEWERYEISLKRKNLSRIACGFGFVASSWENAAVSEIHFSLDEIRFEFPEGKRREQIFLQRYEAAPLNTEGAVINNFAYLYDNAISAMALSAAGYGEESQQIADAIVFAVEHDRYFNDGRLRNAYLFGDLESEPGWLSRHGDVYARMPGFYDELDETWREDVYAASSSTGNMAWALIALSEAYENSSDEDAKKREARLDVANRLADFLLTLESQTGGFTAGYEGWEGEQTAATYKSTEHNIDLYCAFTRLANIERTHEDNPSQARAKIYDEAAAHAKAFILSMYDSDRGCFYTGTETDGVRISKDILPLDVNTWALLALGDEFARTEGKKIMTFVEENMSSALKDGAPGGYSFQSGTGGIWYEGTAQVALAYKAIGDETKYQEILTFLNESALSDGSIYATDTDGLSTGFSVTGTNIPWEYTKRIHAGATAWLAFAQLGVNPLE